MRLALAPLSLALIVVMACGGGEGTPTPTAAVDATATNAPPRPPPLTATATAVPTPTATATPPPPEVELPNEPRETIVDRPLAVPPRPPSSFDAGDPRDGRMRLYDIEAGAVTDFGPGSMGEFSADSRFMVRTRRADDPDAAELVVLDLETRAVTVLGLATLTRLTFAPGGIARGPERASPLDLDLQPPRSRDRGTA